MTGSPQDSSSPGSGTSPLPSAFERLVGTRLGEYDIQRLVGHGSMGVVFEAWHGTLGRRVALKVLPPSLGTSERSIQRFLRAGLIESLIVTRVPVLIGGGRPLFGALDGDVKLRHVATRSYPTGLVQSEYAVEG